MRDELGVEEAWEELSELVDTLTVIWSSWFERSWSSLVSAEVGLGGAGISSVVGEVGAGAIGVTSWSGSALGRGGAGVASVSGSARLVSICSGSSAVIVVAFGSITSARISMLLFASWTGLLDGSSLAIPLI